MTESESEALAVTKLAMMEGQIKELSLVQVRLEATFKSINKV